MRRFNVATLLSLGIVAMLAGPVSAQTWDKAQKEVWEVVLASYKDIDSKRPTGPINGSLQTRWSGVAPIRCHVAATA